jgi:hypothetical protein
MANKLYDVFGELMRDGKPQEYNNLFEAKNPEAAKKAAEKDYLDYLKAGYEPGVKYGPKLKVTKVIETTWEEIRENK